MKPMKRLVPLAATLALVLPAAAARAQSPTINAGRDPGATNLATSPNSVAAAAAFDAAVPGTTLLTFEPGTATQTNNGGGNFTVNSNGAVITFTNQDRSTPPLDSTFQDALNGFNTTAGGSVRLLSATNDFFAPRTITVTFANPVNAFGTFIGGLGSATGQLILSFNDGAAQSFDLDNLVGNGSGGSGFFGVRSNSGSFSSLTFTLGLEGGSAIDVFSLDDFRFGVAPAVAPVPEPSEAAFAVAFGAGLIGLIVRKRVARTAA